MSYQNSKTGQNNKYITRISLNMAIKQSKKDKEEITKAVIERLKKSIHYLHGASMLIRKLHTDKERIKEETDLIVFVSVEIEDLLNEYLKKF